MTTEDFLRLVLPSQGVYFGAIPVPERAGQFSHKAFRDVAGLANYAAAMSEHGKNVYFACASYKEEKYTAADGKTRRRTKENAAFARAQWIDLDCGEGKDYPDQRAALAALKEFLAKTQLPTPTVLVSSGHGVHVYWVFDRDVDRANWEKLARVFKAASRHFGFKQDWTRAADVASVLRPPGTVNRKEGREPAAVRVLATKDVVPLATWARRLVLLQQNNKFEVEQPVAPRRAANNDLTGGTEFPPTDGERVADRCQQLHFMREFRGVGQAEPTWRACLGVLAYCEDGLALAQAWSSEHEGYDEQATLRKLNERKQRAGPTTCNAFQGVDPERCEGCKHKGKITSPIVLGLPEPAHQTTATVEETVVNEEGDEEVQVVEETFPEFPENLAKDFRWSGTQLKARRAADDGEVTWVPCCDQLPIPVHSFYDQEDESYKMRIRVWIRGRNWREADITMKSIAAGGSQLLGELGSNAGVVPKGNGADLVRYMRTWSENIQASREEVTMHMHYGWQEDNSFLTGTAKYMPNGEVKQVRLSGALAPTAKHHVPTGSLARYVELVGHAYNRPQHQVYQFTWLAAFASPLLSLAHNEPVGIPVIGWSKASGQGKSTAARVGMSVWANPNGHNQTANADKITDYSLYALAGERRNLPVLIDETTLKDAKWLAQMAYNYSDGRPKIQGKASGGLRDNSHLEWANIIYMTSNRSVTETMAATIMDCTPQIARVWEYHYDVPHDLTMTREEGETVFAELFKHYGVAGDAFLRFIVPKREQVMKLIYAARNEFANAAGVDKSARFWLLVAASVWAAFLLTAKMGLHSFAAEPFKEWLLEHLRGMRVTAQAANRDILDLFSDMLAEMQGGFIVTNIEGGGRNGAQAVIDPNFGMPRTAIVGRVLTDDRKVYLSQAAARAWCVERGVSYQEMEAALLQKGWMQYLVKKSLGKGVNSALGQTRCLVLDWGVYSSVLASVPAAAAEEASA